MRAPIRPDDLGGGRIEVRPPFLVEAAQGARSADAALVEAAGVLRTAADGSAAQAFAGAAGALERFRSVWLVDLDRMHGDLAGLATAVEVAATEYVRTDARVATGSG